jgi:hypothetical protein
MLGSVFARRDGLRPLSSVGGSLCPVVGGYSSPSTQCGDGTASGAGVASGFPGAGTGRAGRSVVRPEPRGVYGRSRDTTVRIRPGSSPSLEPDVEPTDWASGSVSGVIPLAPARLRTTGPEVLSLGDVSW